MNRNLIVGLCAAVAVVLGLTGAAPVMSQDTGAPNADTHNMELGLPYAAPGRGMTDHDAMRERMLGVLKTEFSAFRTATAALADAAVTYCAAPDDDTAMKAALKHAWLAWAPLDTYSFGPVEANAAVLTVNFWPDKKNFVGRGLAALLKKSPQEQSDPAVVAAGSAAAQGLPALEMLLYTDAPACPAVIGISDNLKAMGETLYSDWFGELGWAELARAAGPENPIYLSSEEFTKTIYTALDYGMIRIADQRLGRPLGTYGRPYPTRAEAWRSGFTADIIHAQLDGIKEMIRLGFAGDLRDPDRNWAIRVIDQTHERINRIGMPISDAVSDPITRLKVEAAQTKANSVRTVLAEDIGPNLGVDTGFSPADGD